MACLRTPKSSDDRRDTRGGELTTKLSRRTEFGELLMSSRFVERAARVDMVRCSGADMRRARFTHPDPDACLDSSDISFPSLLRSRAQAALTSGRRKICATNMVKPWMTLSTVKM